MNDLDPIRWDVVEEHLDEAEFLFELWGSALDSPSYGFGRLCRGLETRLVAHLDGLAIGGEAVAERLLWPALAPEADAPMRVAAVTSALVLEGDAARIDRVLAAVRTLEAGPCRDGIVGALAVSANADLSRCVIAAAEQADDTASVPLLAIAARRGGVPGPKAAAWLERATTSEHADARAVAAAAAIRLPRANALRVAERLLGDASADVRLAAMMTALVHGSTGAYALAVDVTRGRIPGPPALVRASMTAVALVGEPGCVELLHGRFAQADLREHAIWSLGFTGRIDAIDRLLPLLADDELAALAAEAIVGITGLGRSDGDFWRSGVPAEPIALDELQAEVPPEDLDADPVPPAEADLPVPIAEKFLRAWPDLKPKLDPRQRFHEGRPLVHSKSYADVLDETTTRRRHAIAWELAIRTRGALYLPTRGFGGQQKPWLAAIANAGPVDGTRPYARIS